MYVSDNVLEVTTTYESMFESVRYFTTISESGPDSVQ